MRRPIFGKRRILGRGRQRRGFGFPGISRRKADDVALGCADDETSIRHRKAPGLAIDRGFPKEFPGRGVMDRHFVLAAGNELVARHDQLRLMRGRHFPDIAFLAL